MELWSPYVGLFCVIFLVSQNSHVPLVDLSPGTSIPDSSFWYLSLLSLTSSLHCYLSLSPSIMSFVVASIHPSGTGSAEDDFLSSKQTVENVTDTKWCVPVVFVLSE